MASKAILEELNILSSKIFGTQYKSNNSRTGRKFVVQELKGAKLKSYYPATINYRQLRTLLNDKTFPDSDEELRMEIRKGYVSC